MGFLRKIFRRKSDGTTNNMNHSGASPTSTLAIPNDTTTSSTVRKSSWRNSNNGNSNNNKTNIIKGQNSSSSSISARQSLAVREDSPTQLIVDDIALIPLPSSNSSSRRVMRGPDESDGTQPPILSPRTFHTTTNTPMNVSAKFSDSINHQSHGVLKLTPRSTQPVDLDDSQSESMIESIHSREPPPPSSSTTPSNHDSELPLPSSSTGRAPIFTMPDSSTNTNNHTTTTTMMLPKLRFSAGNVSVGSEDTDGESSSFNLSTDAEDTEYEAMRRRLGATGLMLMTGGGGGGGSIGTNTNMDMSVANYTTDGETSVFPGLQSEDDATQTTASVTKEASQHSILHLPTVNPATGASLVPVGYVTNHTSNSSHPYAGSVGFPGAAAYKASHDRSLSNQLKVEESNKNKHNTNGTMNGMIKPREDSNGNQFTKTNVEEKSDGVEMAQSFRHRIIGHRSTTPTSSSNPSTTLLESSKRDSPDPKIQRSSPNTNQPVVVGGTSTSSRNTTNNGSFTQYPSNFSDAIYGSSTANHNVNGSKTNPTSLHSQQQQQVAVPAQRRSFTSPKKASTTTTEKPQTSTIMTDFDPFTMDNTTGFTSSNDMDLFADFADFSNFDNAFTNTSSTPASEPSPTPPAVGERVGRTAASPFIDRPDEKSRLTRHTSIGSTTSNNGNHLQNHHRNSLPAAVSGAAHNDTSLSELLEKAKSKSSRSNGSHAKKTSTSVNSAPAHMTASYLRQHHNLGSKSRSSKGGDGASVTDIIQSLEAANATRLTSGSSIHSHGNGRHGGNSSRDDGFSSAHSREGGSSVMSAKEKIRRRRERRHQRGGDTHSSDSENEHQENESWLFDEVTGALGPRGIAADLESLSGRSNRSSSSRGNKSHRSHRSHKSGSRSSRHHRPKTDSADSVDSHHSRDSRRSRGSRYSHRSTRSYISQMSEQSRSVANDLLRLEMQLAMVGSAGVPGLDGGAGSSSVGGIARNTRSLSSRSTPPVTTPALSVPSTTSGTGARRMATARRSRITIQAPAGRLGIILANKADARGTVVSGVRSNSALVDRITPGDRIVAIDGEDVSLMTVSEITTIMARKADFERTLTVLTTPRHADTTSNTGGMNSPRSAGDTFQQHKSSYRG